MQTLCSNYPSCGDTVAVWLMTIRGRVEAFGSECADEFWAEATMVRGVKVGS